MCFAERGHNLNFKVPSKLNAMTSEHRVKYGVSPYASLAHAWVSTETAETLNHLGDSCLASPSAVEQRPQSVFAQHLYAMGRRKVQPMLRSEI